MPVQKQNKNHTRQNVAVDGAYNAFSIRFTFYIISSSNGDKVAAVAEMAALVMVVVVHSYIF